MSSVGDDATVLLESLVLLLGVAGESPVLGDDDSLTSGELVLGTTESLNDVGDSVGLAADGEEDLTDVDAGNKTVGLTESTTHSSLESVVMCDTIKIVFIIIIVVFFFCFGEEKKQKGQ